MLKGKGYLSTHVCFPNLNCFMDAWFDSQMPIHRFHPHLRGFRYIYIYVVYIYINTTCLHVHLSFKPLTWQYGLPKDFPNGCCRYAMSQKNNMSTVDNQSVPILKMCEWVQLATDKHPDLVVLCIKSTSDTSRSSKNRTSQKSENSISIYHPQKQLNRVSAPHVPRSKEISHIRPLHFFCDLFLVVEWQMCVFFCRIWSHIVATCFNGVGPSHGHGPATLPRSLDTFGGHVATPYGSMSIHVNHIYLRFLGHFGG